MGGELPFPISPACDGHGLIADPHAPVARIAAKRRVAVITPAFPLPATRLPLEHLNLSGCSTATPDRKPMENSRMPRLRLRLTPHGRLSVEDQDDGPDIDAAASIRLIDAFARGTGYGLVWLGAAEVGQALPPLFVWWRDFAALYVGSLCLHASGMEAERPRKLPSVPAPTAAELSSLVLTAPIMAGAEYLTQGHRQLGICGLTESAMG